MKLETKLDRLRKKSEGDFDIKKLKDINNVNIDPTLSSRERVASFIDQIDNPYIFKCGEIVVRIAFKGDQTLEECMAHAIQRRPVTFSNNQNHTHQI
jgi:hypothetical protein